MNFVYSTFNPTLPNPLIPPAQIKLLTTQAPKQVQKPARYPFHNAPVTSTLLVSELRSAAVTLAATIDVIAKPTEFPICATVLNTPPANACVQLGNSEVIAKFEMVYKTNQVRTGCQSLCDYTIGREGNQRHSPKCCAPVTPLQVHVRKDHRGNGGG